MYLNRIIPDNSRQNFEGGALSERWNKLNRHRDGLSVVSPITSTSMTFQRVCFSKLGALQHLKLSINLTHCNNFMSACIDCNMKLSPASSLTVRVFAFQLPSPKILNSVVSIARCYIAHIVFGSNEASTCTALSGIENTRLTMSTVAVAKSQNRRGL